MNLPPLPLTNGAFLIDNSTLEKLQCCPREMEYSAMRKRIGAGVKPSLNFGSAIHSALEHRYKEYKNESPDIFLEEAQAKLLSEYFDLNPNPIDDFRNTNWAIELMKMYNQKYNVEPFNLLVDKAGKTMVELSFALPLVEINKIPIIYSGRIDLPVMWDNQLIIIDHKTTSMLGPQYFEEFKMSAQPLGYAWAFEQLTGQKVAGYGINAIRVRSIPAKPKAGIASWWDETFQRDKTYIRPRQLEEWKNNVIHLIEEFFWHISKDYLPMKTKWCVGKYGRCQYFDVCSLPQESRALMLESNNFTANTWSPLKQPTQSLQ